MLLTIGLISSREILYISTLLSLVYSIYYILAILESPYRSLYRVCLINFSINFLLNFRKCFNFFLREGHKQIRKPDTFGSQRTLSVFRATLVH